MIRKITISLALILLLGADMLSQENTALTRLYENLRNSCVELDYSYLAEVSGVKINGNGLLELQDKLWHMDGNGVEMWCNGTDVWSADVEAKEVIIEAVSDDNSAEFTNPAVLFIRMDEFFDVKETAKGKDADSVIYVLYPKTDTDIQWLNVEVRKSDASLVGASFALEDGNSVRLKVSSMKLTQKKPVSYYRPSFKFGTDWIVTDLRQ